MNRKIHFGFVASLVLIVSLWTAPSALAQVAGEKQAAGLPEFKKALAEEQKVEVLKGPESKVGPVKQTQSAPAGKSDFSDLNDHLAFIFDFKGNVRILKRDTDLWAPVKKEMKIEVGDEILTGKDSVVDIAYDRHFLNIARIGANTKAEFVTIEPTDIHMEDGTIFSALDGLKKGDNYQISTRTAVAGVRGTEFGVVAAGDLVTFFVLDEKDIAINHEVEVTNVNYFQDRTTVNVPEGKQLDLTPATGNAELKEIQPELLNQLSELESTGAELRKEVAAEEFSQSVEVPAEENQESSDDNKKGVGGGNGDDGLSQGNELLNKMDSVIDNYLDSAIDLSGEVAGESNPEKESAANDAAEGATDKTGQTPAQADQASEPSESSQAKAADDSPADMKTTIEEGENLLNHDLEQTLGVAKDQKEFLDEELSDPSADPLNLSQDPALAEATGSGGFNLTSFWDAVNQMDWSNPGEAQLQWLQQQCAQLESEGGGCT